MAKWIAADGIQLRVCEMPAFREFCTVLDSKCPAIGRKAITNQIHTFYEDAVQRLSQDGKWQTLRPAFTCDLWHGPGPKEYMTLTTHWVEPTPEAFELRMRVLGSFVVPEVHMEHGGKCSAVPLWVIRGIAMLALCYHFTANFLPFHALAYTLLHGCKLPATLCWVHGLSCHM